MYTHYKYIVNYALHKLKVLYRPGTKKTKIESGFSAQGSGIATSFNLAEAQESISCQDHFCNYHIEHFGCR